MFASTARALALIFDPAFYAVAFKAVLLTIGLFVALFLGLELLLHLLAARGNASTATALEWLVPVLFILSFFYLGAPVAALFGSLFVDEIASAIENTHYALDPKAPGTSFATNLKAGLRMAGVIVLVDVVLLPVNIFLPGIAWIATVAVNGFLLGREYFELAALRHLPLAAADALRKRCAGQVFAGGLIISVLTAVPLVNLFAPLFGAALMVHFFKQVTQEIPA